MLGWLTAASRRASRSNRAMLSASFATASLTSLIATSRPSFVPACSVTVSFEGEDTPANVPSLVRRPAKRAAQSPCYIGWTRGAPFPHLVNWSVHEYEETPLHRRRPGRQRPGRRRRPRGRPVDGEHRHGRRLLDHETVRRARPRGLRTG